MRAVLVLGVVVTAFAFQAQAQSLSTLPQAGLWEADVQMLVNGEDVMAKMRAARAEMMKKLTPEQRKMMESMQPASASDKTLSCLDEKNIAEFADPRKALAKSMKEQQHCKADVVSVSGNTVKYKVRCDDPQGTTGDFNGEYTLLDTQHWTYTMQGKGQMAAAGNKPIEMKTSSQGRWVSADCGSVKPE